MYVLDENKKFLNFFEDNTLSGFFGRFVSKSNRASFSKGSSKVLQDDHTELQVSSGWPVRLRGNQGHQLPAGEDRVRSE